MDLLGLTKTPGVRAALKTFRRYKKGTKSLAIVLELSENSVKKISRWDGVN